MSLFISFYYNLRYSDQAKDLAIENNSKEQLARILHLLGIIFNDLGDYDKSSGYLFESLNLNEEAKTNLFNFVQNLLL